MEAMGKGLSHVEPKLQHLINLRCITLNLDNEPGAFRHNIPKAYPVLSEIKNDVHFTPFVPEWTGKPGSGVCHNRNGSKICRR